MKRSYRAKTLYTRKAKIIVGVLGMSHRKIFKFPIIEYKMEAAITLPAYDAFRMSPYWRPVRTYDGIVYLWTRLTEDETLNISNKEKMQEIEAILLPLDIDRANKFWYLYYVTRTKRIPMIILVKPGVPGGNIRNIFRKAIKIEHDYRITKVQLIIAWIMSKRGLSCYPNEDYWTLTCYDEESKKHYCVLCGFEKIEIEEIQT